MWAVLGSVILLTQQASTLIVEICDYVVYHWVAKIFLKPSVCQRLSV